MPLISRRMAHIKPSPTLAVAARAAEIKALGRDVIDLGAGEPDFDTPQFIKDAAIQALINGKTKYTPVSGILSLRKAIVQKFKRENDIDYTPEQIIVGVGAKQVIFNALLASLNPGDEVIIPAPYWVSYPDMVSLAEGTSVIVRCAVENHLKLTPNELEKAITPRTKWLILNSPNNPSGMAYSRQDLENLAAILRRYSHVHILSDDIYEHLVYDGFRFTTLAQIAPDLKERVITVNGISKSYSMTGWRIGYGAGPISLIKAMAVLQSQSTSNATSISQEAALAALESSQDFLREWVRVFTERRNQALKILNDTPGLSCVTPQGAFYLYPSCAPLIGTRTPSKEVIASDSDLATYLLDTAGVAVVPGIAFGMSPYFRISYATETKILLEGCQRISEAIKELR